MAEYAPLLRLKYPPEGNSESIFGIRRVQLVQVAKETGQYEQLGRNLVFIIRGTARRFLRGFSTSIGGTSQTKRAVELCLVP